MLFKPEHRRMICERTKTETRRPVTQPASAGAKQSRTRVARRPAIPGKLRGFYTRPAFVKPPGVPFCRSRILSVAAEPLEAITDAGALAEGYPTRAGFVKVWNRIWGPLSFGCACARGDSVWVVKFRLVYQLTCAGCGGSKWTELRTVKGPHVAKYCALCADLLENFATVDTAFLAPELDAKG